MSTPFRKLMMPDFQAQPAPQMEWMPWEDGSEAASAGTIADKLKTMRQPKTEGGGLGSAVGKAAGGGLKLGGAASL